MPPKFATYEEAADLIVDCSKCGKDRNFSVVEVPSDGETYFILERCLHPDCDEHCHCPPVVVTIDLATEDTREIASYYQNN